MARKKTKTEAPHFESSLESLKSIIQQLENGKLTLSESLERYEEGIKRLKECHDALNLAQLKIEQLVGLDDDGTLTTKPFDNAASFADPSVRYSQQQTSVYLEEVEIQPTASPDGENRSPGAKIAPDFDGDLEGLLDTDEEDDWDDPQENDDPRTLF